MELRKLLMRAKLDFWRGWKKHRRREEKESLLEGCPNDFEACNQLCIQRHIRAGHCEGKNCCCGI
jgi:hypothetical protein